MAKKFSVGAAHCKGYVILNATNVKFDSLIKAPVITATLYRCIIFVIPEIITTGIVNLITATVAVISTAMIGKIITRNICHTSTSRCSENAGNTVIKRTVRLFGSSVNNAHKRVAHSRCITVVSNSGYLSVHSRGVCHLNFRKPKYVSVAILHLDRTVRHNASIAVRVAVSYVKTICNTIMCKICIRGYFGISRIRTCGDSHHNYT